MCRRTCYEQICKSEGGQITHQQLEEPEAGLVVASLEGVDEEEEEEAVQHERVGQHGDMQGVGEEARQDAHAPQHAQEACDLDTGGEEVRSFQICVLQFVCLYASLDI